MMVSLLCAETNMVWDATSLQRDPVAASSPHHYDNRRIHLAQCLNQARSRLSSWTLI